MKKNYPQNVAILIFDDVEVLDFCGPFEVFSVTNRDDESEVFNVYTVAKSETVLTRGGLSVNRHYSISDCPTPDIFLIPGGAGVRKILDDSEIIEWIKTNAETAQFVTSVCTGALMLGRCCLLDGIPATTHFQCLDELRVIAPKARVLENRRFVDTGRLITSAGIAAGIDMSLHIVGRIIGKDRATEVAATMEYPHFEAQPDPKIHENHPGHLAEFISLNERWIAEHFEIEECDQKLAADPASVWREGGAIFTATVNDQVVGCCALFKKSDDVFELARMAVHPDFQKQGIGKKLANHAMQKLEESGAKRVELLTNTVLEPAIKLYRSLGFETVSEAKHAAYKRCNLVMAKQV